MSILRASFKRNAITQFFTRVWVTKEEPMFDPAACFDGPLLLVQGSLLATQCVGMSHSKDTVKMDDFRFLPNTLGLEVFGPQKHT